MLIEIRNGTKSFGADIILKDINLSISENDRIALVGRNGSGKTTLFKILTNLESLDSGTIHVNNRVKVGYLAQITFQNEENLVKDELLTVFDNVSVIANKIEKLTTDLALEYDDGKLQELSKAQSQFEALDGYTLMYKIENIFTRFGFAKEDLERKLKTYSGGQKTKIALVKMLLSEPDLLLLDEPTNHLDLDAIEWLENYLSEYPKAMVIISHDRFFIDRICKITYEIELTKLTRYGGNYSFFQKAKEAQLELERKLYKTQQEEIARLEVLIEKFRYKKNKAAFAQSKIKYLDRMDKIEITKTDTKAFKANFTTEIKGGKNVCAINDLVIGYDKPLANLKIDITRGERIGIIGINGCGKSTLLKTLAGRVEKLAGDIKFGHQIKASYFDQGMEILDLDNNVVEELWEAYPELTRTQVRSILGQFLFSEDEVLKEIRVLSGGEKVRLSFAKLMLEKANFLLLDEPTNHLDVSSKEVLEKALKDYQGTLLLVSHDRYFIQQVATSLLVYENDNFVYYPLTYQEYKDKVVPIVVESKIEEVNEKPKIINREKQLKKVEKQIEKSEKALKELEELSFQPEYYENFIMMGKLQEEIDQESDNLAKLTREWEELML